MRNIFGEALLVLFSAFTIFGVIGIQSDFFVVLLKSGKILPGLREFSLLHTLSNVPVDEGPLGVHKVKLMIQTSPGFSDGSGVGEHADSSGDLGEISSRNNGGWLVVDTDLEPSGTPVNELDAPLGLDGCDGGINVLWHNISTVEQTAGHVLSMTGIALDHLVGWLEAGVGDFSHGELLMVSLLGRDDWSVGDQWEMDPGVGHQVGLEFGQVDIEGTVESQGSSDGGDDLADDLVEIGVGWAVDVQVTPADVVDGFVVDHKGAVGVLQGGMGGQDGVVGFNNSRGNLGSWVDGKLEL